jgi:hypothetical protein
VSEGDRAPVPVGGFSGERGGAASFTTRPAETPAGSQIVVTLEPNPGNTAPKGPAVSSGIASAPTAAVERSIAVARR